MPSHDRSTTHAADESEIAAIVQRLVDAWNRGSGADFAAPFADDADFIAFEGTRLQGRQQIATFHQHVFDTVMKGTRLGGEARFVRVLTPQLALLHAVASSSLPGESRELAASRSSMQLFVLTKTGERWQAVAVMNARKLSLEQQSFWDDYSTLPAAAQAQVRELIARAKSAPPSGGAPGR